MQKLNIIISFNSAYRALFFWRFYS